MITTARGFALSANTTTSGQRTRTATNRRWINKILAGTILMALTAGPTLAAGTALQGIAASAATTASQPELHLAGGGDWGG